MTSLVLKFLIGTAAMWSTACAIGVSPPEPTLQAGLVHDTGFEPFEAGDTMDVLTAVQAGLWLMPTLRHQGFDEEPRLRCTAFDMDKDTFLAEQAAHVSARVLDDWTHVLYNMQVHLPNGLMDDVIELQDYDGDRVLFQCRADDEFGNSFALSHEMILSAQQ